MYDLAIIGGGVNGCGIARDAAGRGLKVVLFEQADLASGTSSASTKLIHGGLRYLEHYKFRLVREALQERSVLQRIAPHNVRPLRFALPYHEGLRPRWMLRAGLFLYDALGDGALLRAKALDSYYDVESAPLKRAYQKGFLYSDCWTDDARLVVLNAIDARERGAEIHTRTKVTRAVRDAQGWTLTAGGAEIRARMLVNAAGAWVQDVLDAAHITAPARARLVQGSHIVVPRLFAHESAYIFQQRDGRIVFAIPYEDDFTLIGTTDQDWQGDPATAHASEQEMCYLCDAANEYFTRQIALADIVWSYSGVRALYDDGASAAQEVTRDYVLSLDSNGPPLLTLYGGKITTYRRLAEAALKKLGVTAPAWTKTAPLPGGDIASVEACAAALQRAHAFLAPPHALRLARAYGSRATRIFANGQGETLFADFTAAELTYLAVEEWARTAEDVLWRRTKLGLRATPQDVARVSDALGGA